jgi:hypothetical protein
MQGDSAMFLFAEVSAFTEFFWNALLLFIVISGFMGWLLKRTDKNGAIKGAAGRAAKRGGMHLLKRAFKR